MIIFPATGVFANLGPMGVSMFFISTILAQLVYTLGGSDFHGANGSMMIEVVVSLFLFFLQFSIYGFMVNCFFVLHIAFLSCHGHHYSK